MPAAFARTFVSLCLLAVSGFATAQEPVRMLCQGTLETRRDELTDTKPATVDAKLDLANESLELEGFWGCLADLGNRSQDPSTYQCVGKQRVKISDDEVLYARNAEGPLYSAQTYARLNRFTSTLTVHSSGSAKPAAGASWRFVQIHGKLLCTIQERKF